MTSTRQRWWGPWLAALVVLGSAWLFLGVLEDVVTRDPLVQVDVLVHAALQRLRTPVVDGVMVALTELGDVAVVLPLAMGALAWFVWHHLWQTSLTWLAAVGGAELLVKVLKWALHRPRPGGLVAGLEQYSFPSGHATLSVVAYGFLAFLLCRGQPARVARWIGAGAALLVGCIAFSRLYLGVHWASDVIAGVSLGLAWVGALAMVYRYRVQEDVQPRLLAVWLMVVLLLAGGWHIVAQHRRDVQRYAPVAIGPVPAQLRATPDVATLPRWLVRDSVLRFIDLCGIHYTVRPEPVEAFPELVEGPSRALRQAQVERKNCVATYGNLNNRAGFTEGVTHGHARRHPAPAG